MAGRVKTHDTREKTLHGSERNATVASKADHFRRGRRHARLRPAASTAARLRLLRVRARRGRRHGASVHGGGRGRAGRARHRDACATSSPTWRRAASGPTRRRSRTRRCAPRSREARRRLPGPAADRGRQVVRRADDLAGAGGRAARRRARARLPRLSAAPGRAPVARARRSIWPTSTIPMLFLQGTRDALADLGELEPVCKALGSRATLKLFADADHRSTCRRARAARMRRCAPRCWMRWPNGSRASSRISVTPSRPCAHGHPLPQAARGEGQKEKRPPGGPAGARVQTLRGDEEAWIGRPTGEDRPGQDV